MKKFFFKNNQKEATSTKNSNFNRVLYTIIIYLLILVSVIVPPTFSKYVTKTNAVDSVAVAKFGVEFVQGNNIFLPIPDTSVQHGAAYGSASATYKFTIKNVSQVTIKYKIKLTGIPTGVTVKVDGVTYVAGQESFKANLATNASRAHTIIFTASASATVATKTIKISAYVEQVN